MIEPKGNVGESSADICEGCGDRGAIYDGLCPRCDACPPWVDFDDGDEESCGHGVLLCEPCIDCEIEEHEFDDD